MLFNVIFLLAGEWLTVILNLPLIAYHIHRLVFFPVIKKIHFLFIAFVFFLNFILKQLIKFNFLNHSYMHRPIMSGPGLYDPTTIMGAQQMNLITKEGWIKLLFYLISFFYYIYGMISSLIVAS